MPKLLKNTPALWRASFPYLSPEGNKYLKRHDINASALRADKTKEISSAMVRNAARKVEAGLIVMGAYTHNRIKENILGGVTDYMLRGSDIPVLITH